VSVLLVASVLPSAVSVADSDPVGPRLAALGSGDLSREEVLILHATALLCGDAAGDCFQTGAVFKERSATGVLNEIKALSAGIDSEDLEMLSSFLERPVYLAAHLDTQHFRLHYSVNHPDAPRGWPDRQFLDAAAQACERIWETYHPELGWPRPLADGLAGGDERVDIYILDLGSGVFGYALHEEIDELAGNTGFIVVDNDYVAFGDLEPSEALRVTLAHEYHHLIQFGFGYAAEAAWFMEQNATMMEGKVFPQITDNYRYLGFYTGHAYRRLDLCNGAFEYGTWLWPRFLSERWGDAFLVSVWEMWGAVDLGMLETLGLALAPKGGLDAAFLEWATWNAFLSDWDDGEHYQYGGAYPRSMQPEARVSRYPAEGIRPVGFHQPQRLGASYLEFRPELGSADNLLMLSLHVCETVADVALITWKGDGAKPVIDTHALLDGVLEVEIPAWDTVERVWVVVANGVAAREGCDYCVSATTCYRTADVGEEEILAGKQVLLHGSPNPFDHYTIFTFRLADRMPVTLRVLDAQGRVVETLVDGLQSAGNHAIRWSGLKRSRAAASGIFFCEIRTPADTQRLRIVRLR
jgi:hypothetical protein